jgi:hypothetical protein
MDLTEEMDKVKQDRRLSFGRWQDHLLDHAGTLIGVALSRWIMVRSNKAITSSCDV